MDLALYGIPIAALILGLVELAKRTFDLDTKYAALVAVVLGLVFALAGRADDPSLGTWFQVSLLGLMTGLSAAGLYGGGKALAGK